MQVRFGAKTGAAPVFLGLLKLGLGLLFGSSLYQLLKAFPQPLLGSLMIFSGALMPPLYLPPMCLDWNSKQSDWQGTCHTEIYSWPVQVSEKFYSLGRFAMPDYSAL